MAFERSIFYGTFFYMQNLTPGEILLVGYYWLTCVPVTTTIMHLGHSGNTICSYYKYYRQLVEQSLDFDNTIIGGEGIEVDIDETKLGRRKYHRGHRVEGVWIVGGVERTPERRVFLVPVTDRSSESLLQIISAHVRPGTIINTDCWRGYSGLTEQLDVTHNTVNHSQFFRDPLTGAHTNYIESTWRGLKIKIPARNRVREGIEGFLFEFAWRRANEQDLWGGLLKALRDTDWHEP
jgi:transposase-like protein